MNKWYEKNGEQGDVIISTRVRLARNLKNYPFPCKLQKDDMQKVNAAVKEALDATPLGGQFDYIDMAALNQTEAVSLVERHLVSPEFISEREGRALLLMKDESVSIMLNEEDHLRIQVMQQGLNLDAAYQLADQLDTLLDERLGFAFDDRLGYLTQCPTNLGTGMRASLMLHLPELQENGVMNRLAGNLSKLGITIRGIYGEGTEPKGALYQLSNQVTLGLSEKAAITNLRDIAMQLVAQERAAREEMAKHLETLDAVGRSLGILQNACLLSNEEFMKLISNVRLGIAMGAVQGISYDQVNALMIEAQPATLMKNAGKNLTPPQRDKQRAELVKQRLIKSDH